VNQLVRQFTGLTGMHSGLEFARGSSALYALLAALAKYEGVGEVIIPSLCCESVALAAIYAGHDLVFADVSNEFICVSPETVAPLLTDRTRAVLVVHLFGCDAKAQSFDSLRRQYPKAVFIEDIAHAIGGYDSHGRMLGGGLDYSLLSFADDKIIPGNGGMLLFGDNTLDPLDVASMIPYGAPHLPQPRLALGLRNIVHGLADLWREQANTKINEAFTTVREGFRDLIICSGEIACRDAVANELLRLDSNRAQRFQNYSFYSNGIKSNQAKVFPLHEGSTCWRCPILFDEPGSAHRATIALRKAGINASNHYFPLNLLFSSVQVPVSESISARIVNLWVDSSVSPIMMNNAINIINDC